MRQPVRALIAVFALALPAAWAHAQSVCVPATTPCQHCPPSPPCGVSANPCGPGGAVVTGSNSQVSCTGSFSQLTVTTTAYVGPTDLCVGPNRSVPCRVIGGGTNYDTLTETISAPAPAAAVPMLSIWALTALAAGLVGLALWRLRPGS